MLLDKINAKEGNSYNVIIEIPMNHHPIKYEFDKSVCAMRVDRFMKTAMFYPANYGFIPHTLSDDGDPVDVLVFSAYPIMSGAIINVRPIAVLIMEDESGLDEKIISVPTEKIDTAYDNMQDLGDIKSEDKDQIEHFFEHYKRLEKGKWVKIKGWSNKNEAIQIIETAIDNYSKN